MKLQDELKLMAYVDGELSGADLIEAEALLARDTRAAELAEELRMTRAVLTVNEPEAELPIPHGAYWAAIAREIEHEPQSAVDWTALLRPAFWLRYLSPVAALGVIVMVAVLQTNPGAATDGEELFTSPEASAVVYHSDEQKMTVVWLQTDENSDVPQQTEADPF